MSRTIVLVVALLAVARGAAAQTSTAQTITLAPTDPKQWDFGVHVGWLGGNKSDLAEDWNDWYDAFATSVEAGRYWTPHLKTEAAVIVTTDGAVYSQEELVVPGQPSPFFFAREHHFGLTALRLGGAYQFLENAWVHPFIGGGLQLEWERHRIDMPFPFVFGPDPQTRFPIPPLDEAPHTSFGVRPFVTAGAKFYVSERGFIRSDLSAAFGSGSATNVSWRAGIGIDF